MNPCRDTCHFFNGCVAVAHIKQVHCMFHLRMGEFLRSAVHLLTIGSCNCLSCLCALHDHITLKLCKP